MRKVLKGKVYDTDTAKEVGYYSYLPGDRLYGHSETLHRKRTGEYFLCCEGGPGSKYSEDIDRNNRSGLALIKPLSYEDARKWAEENLSVDEYKSEFGIVDEDEDVVSIHVQIPTALNDRLDSERSKTGTSKAGIVIAALEKYL